MPRGKKEIIHWTDPRYLETFYELFGSGQSIPVRRTPQEGETDKTSDRPVESGDDDE